MNLSEAHELLGLTAPTEMSEILSQYRSLVAEQHEPLLGDPDPTASLTRWAELAEALQVSVLAVTAGRSEDHLAAHPDIDWPSALEAEEVAIELRRFAEQHRDIDADYFGENLGILNVSVAGFEMRHLLDRREEFWSEAGGRKPPSFQASYTGNIASVVVNPSNTLTAHKWQFIDSDSPATKTCPDCQHGQQTCGSCAGNGYRPCTPTERCIVCSGGDSSCSSCNGRGTVHCSKCKGSSQEPCNSCWSTGMISCSTCTATGYVTEYKFGIIEQSISTSNSGGVPRKSPFGKQARRAHWARIKLPGDKVPSGMPVTANREAKSVLPRLPGEIARKLTVSTLRITEVEYDGPESREKLYIVGNGASPEISAPYIRSRRRKKRLLALTVVAAAMAGIYLAILAIGSLGNSNSTPAPTFSTQLSTPITTAPMTTPTTTVPTTEPAVLVETSSPPFRVPGICDFPAGLWTDEQHPDSGYDNAGALAEMPIPPLEVDLGSDGETEFVTWTKCGYPGGNRTENQVFIFGSDGILLERIPMTYDLAADWKGLYAITHAVPNDIQIEEDTFIIQVRVHIDGDPSCCPSLNGSLTYSLDSGAFVLITSELDEIKAESPSETQPLDDDVSARASPSGFLFFESPSQNIRCVVDRESARCEIAQKEWATPSGSPCNEPYGPSLFVDATSASFVCFTDSIWAESATTLEYGTATQIARVLCESEETGITCTHDNGYQLHVRRKDYFLGSGQ